MFKVLCNTLQTKTFKSALFLMGCLLCTEALATIFSVAPTDRSKIYLGMVFGGSVGGIQLSGDSNNTLSLMFARFNYIILTIGVLVISYIGVSSTINTAREGEALGKKMSLWVPMRAMLGTLLMVPSPASGYSVVQMTVLWIVLNGIGAANSVWAVVLSQLQQGVGIVASTSVTIAGVNFQGNLDPIAESVMLASTCMHAINDKMPELKNIPGVFQNAAPVKPFVVANSNPVQPNNPTNPTVLTQTTILNIGSESANGIYNQLCGSFTIFTEVNATGDRNTFNEATVQQRTAVKLAALQAVFTAVDPATRLITQSLTTANGALDARFYIPPAPGYYLAAKQAYASTIAQLYQGVKLSPGAGAKNWERGLTYDGSSAIIDPDSRVSITNPINGPINGIDGAIDAAGNVVNAAGEVINNAGDLINSVMNPAALAATIPVVQSYGWIHAGSYYYALVKNSIPPPDADSIRIPTSISIPRALSTELDANGMPPGGTWLSYSGPNNAALTGPNGLLTGNKLYLQTTKLKNYLGAIKDYYTIDMQNRTLSSQGRQLIGGNSSTGNEFLDTMIRYTIGILQDNVLGGMQALVAGNGQDPLASLHQFGWGLMIAAEIMTFAAIGASFGISLAGSAGSCMSPLPWGIDILLSQVFPLILALFAMLWTGGATLNVYLPMVPYLIFTTAAFSWLLTVIEAVVGAPIVALALAHPSGEELGKVGAPLVLLANVFLRPMLMLFGFVLGAGLLRAGIGLINFGFLPAINGATTPSLFSIVAVLMMYMMLIMSIVNKSFSLIYLLPNQIMRWLGGPTETSDPSEMIKEAKGGFDTGAKMGQAAANEGGNQAKSAITEAKGKAKERREAAAAEAKKEGGKGEMPVQSTAVPPAGGGGGPGSMAATQTGGVSTVTPNGGPPVVGP